MNNYDDSSFGDLKNYQVDGKSEAEDEGVTTLVVAIFQTAWL